MFEQRKVGGYFQLVSELSSGGFGQTFLAEDLRRSETPKCVVKQLKPQSNEPAVIDLAKRLFEQEVRVLYKLGEHPQIPSIITHFEEDNEFYFVQEYIEGNTFAQELRQGRVFSQRQVIEIVSELLSVLAFVHRQDVIHRDVKPSNLINRKSDGKTVLIDFGAVKQVSNRNTNNRSQTTMGTIAIGSEGYMPMEQLAGNPRFSSDVYAVGMFAIQLLTQTHPAELRQNQRTGEWIWQDKASVNNQLAEFLNRMIRFDFRQRFTDAVEALNYLKRINLDAGRIETPVWNQNGFGNTGDGRMTQATFFSPGSSSVQQEFYNNPVNNQPAVAQPVFAPKPILQGGVQPAQPFQQNLRPFNVPQNNLPNQFTQPVTRFRAPIELGPNKRVETGNVTMGALAFEGLGDMVFSRAVIYTVLILLGGGILIYSVLGAVQTEYREAQFTQTQKELPKMPTPSLKRDKNAGYMSVAIEKTRKASTIEDWNDVVLEWKNAEAYYANVETSAPGDLERQNAREDKEYCSQNKENALRRIEALKRKENKRLNRL